MYRIINRHKEPGGSLVDRSTPLGNPFQVQEYGRDEAISKYRLWFALRVSTDSTFAQCVEAVRDQDLACWCDPLPCHAKVIMDYLYGS